MELTCVIFFAPSCNLLFSANSAFIVFFSLEQSWTILVSKESETYLIFWRASSKKKLNFLHLSGKSWFCSQMKMNSFLSFYGDVYKNMALNSSKSGAQARCAHQTRIKSRFYFLPSPLFWKWKGAGIFCIIWTGLAITFFFKNVGGTNFIYFHNHIFFLRKKNSKSHFCKKKQTLPTWPVWCVQVQRKNMQMIF